MSSSSRHSMPSPPPIKVKRTRASTKKLLGTEYQEIVTEIFEPPKPEMNPATYDANRLKKSLRYADAILRNPERKLSPLGESSVILYKEAVVYLLDNATSDEVQEDDETKDIKSKYLSLVRMHEEAAQFRSYLNLLKSSDAQELQTRILELMRMAFFARYGDAFADICTKLRAEAEAKKVLGWQTLCGDYWTEIHQKLMLEKVAYNEVLAGKKAHGACPTHMAIAEVCQSVGFTIDEALSIVELYATRNQLVHADLEIMVKHGRFDDLKNRLAADLENAPKAISQVEGVQLNLVQKMLNVIIDRWFTKNPIDEDNVQLWEPTKDLKDLYGELRKGKEASTFKQMMKQINTEVARRLQNEVIEKGLVELVQTNFGLMSGSNRVKRVASSELAEESRRASKLVFEWKRLNSMAYGVRVKSQEYKEEYGALERPPFILRDHTLD